MFVHTSKDYLACRAELAFTTARQKLRCIKAFYNFTQTRASLTHSLVGAAQSHPDIFLDLARAETTTWFATLHVFWQLLTLSIPYQTISHHVESTH